MSLMTSLRLLNRQLQQDPSAIEEVAVLRRLGKSTFIWLILVEAAQMAQIYPIKLFFDGFGHRSNAYLASVAGLMALLYWLGSLLNRHMNLRRMDFYWRMWSFWWGYGNSRQLKLSASWHTAHSTGEKESQLGRNIERVDMMIDTFLFDTFPMLLQLVFTVVVVSFIDWRFGILAVLTLVVYLGAVVRNERIMGPLRAQKHAELKQLERQGTELTQNWRTIKQFGLEDQIAGRNWRNLLAFAGSEMRREQVSLRLQNRQENAITFSRGGLYWLLGLIIAGTNLGTAVVVSSWMERLYSNLYRFSDFQRRLNEGQEALRELVEVLQIVPEVRQSEQPQWPDDFTGKVEFDQVGFSYPQGKQDALSEFNLTVEPNQTVALVGYSGSGKSTLASLLLREYDPTEGQLLIDGIDLRQLDFDRYRQKGVAVVSQEVKVFDDTIRNNIRMVADQAPLGAEVEAAKAAYADEFIRQLPQGYDTPIGENGVRLSGGQKQRLAIARALLRRPRILILDEATSSLDALSQKEIQLTIDRLIEARLCTIFVIAHRFSTIMSADIVVVMENGRMSEMGTHDQLRSGQGIYSQLRHLEMEGMLAAE